MENKEVNKSAQELGKLGGIARAQKYSKEQLSQWAKKGGRPRKNAKRNRTNKEIV